MHQAHKAMIGIAVVFLFMQNSWAGGLPQSISVLPQLTKQSVQFSASNPNGDKATMAIVSVKGQSFDQAVRVTVPKRVDPFYRVQVMLRSVESVPKGKTCLIRFWMRTLESKDESTTGQLTAYFQTAAPKWKKSIMYSATSGSDWTLVNIPFKSLHDHQANGSTLGLAFGTRVQVVEVAAVELLMFDDAVTVQDLPQTSSAYADRSPDAKWRDAAAKRIAKHRMADMKFNVTDVHGTPIVNANVKIELKQHAFGFGSAVTVDWLHTQSATADIYRQTILDQFNRVVFENDLKMHRWDNPINRRKTLESLQWLKDQQIAVHGHVMVWPSWRHMTQRAKRLENNHDALRKLFTDLITDQATQAGPFIKDWDVINEAFGNHDIMDLLGNDVMVDWFKTARKVNDQIELMVNETGILVTGDAVPTERSNHYQQTIKYLLDQKTPVDAIGFQGHFDGSRLTSIKDLGKIIDRFASYGLPMHITEFDINTLDEQLQADYTRDFMTYIFSRPEFKSITMWGFWEKAHWRPNAAMFKANWQAKSNLEAYRQLLFEQWHTDEQGKTDAKGIFQRRGYCGKYQIDVMANGKKQTQYINLNHDGTVVNIKLK